MSTKNFETTIIILQKLAEEWSSQFDTRPPINLQFHLTPENLLAINGIILAPVSDINAEGSSYDVEYLNIFSSDGSFFEIHINWSEDSVCKIEYINHIKTVYYAAS